MVALKPKLLTFTILCAAMLAGTVRMDAQTPAKSGDFFSADDSTPVPWKDGAASCISIPITLELAEMQKLANDSVPEILSGTKGDIGYRVHRSVIALSGRDGKLLAKVAFHGSVTYTKYAKGGLLGKWNVKLFKKSAKFAGTVEAVVGVKLTKDWSIVPDVSVHVDLNKAETRLFKAIKISIRGLVEKKINEVADRAASQAVTKALAKAGLKERVDKVWTRLHRTVFPRRVPGGFVQVDPVSAGISPLQITNKTIGATVTIRTQLRGSLGEPLAPLVAEPLPPLDTAPVKNPGFNLRLPMILDPAQLGVLMQARAERKAMKSGKAQVSIKNLQASCAAGKLRISADVKSPPIEGLPEVDGNLMVEGIPVLDTNSQVLSMKGLAYTLETQNKFAGAANWLLKDQVLRDLEKHLTVNLKRDTDKMAIRLAKAATEEGQKNGLKVSLTGTVVKAAGLEVRGDTLAALLTASGKAEVQPLPLESLVHKPAAKRGASGAKADSANRPSKPAPSKPGKAGAAG